MTTEGTAGEHTAGEHTGGAQAGGEHAARPGGVCPAEPFRAPEIADTLAAAFVDDPVLGWLLPDRRRRPAALRSFFAVEAGAFALPHGSSVGVTDPDGTVTAAALVLPPGQWRRPLGLQARHAPRFVGIFRRRLVHALAVQATMEHHHPREPRLYISFMGVRPEAQGRGLGTAMLAELLAGCDARGRTAYLEASSPGNARLYRRHGFVTRGTLRPWGAPPLELMTRTPR